MNSWYYSVLIIRNIQRNVTDSIFFLLLLQFETGYSSFNSKILLIFGTDSTDPEDSELTFKAIGDIVIIQPNY